MANSREGLGMFKEGCKASDSGAYEPGVGEGYKMKMNE